MPKFELSLGTVEGTAADAVTKDDPLTLQPNGDWHNASDKVILTGLQAKLLTLMYPGFATVTAAMITARFDLK